MNDDVVLMEGAHDQWGEYTVFWHVPPPKAGESFRARDEWKSDYNERHIYEWWPS
jgi:hypothetical protein